MPFIFSKNIENRAHLALWRINEDIDTLIPLLDPNKEESMQISQLRNEQRIKQWLACRIIIKKLLADIGKEYNGISKDKNGKPFLKETSCSISISHSKNYAAAILTEERSNFLMPGKMPQRHQGTKNHKVNHRLHRLTTNYTDFFKKTLCSLVTSCLSGIFSVFKKPGSNFTEASIDIELIREKILVIAPKFLTDTELIDAAGSIEKTHVYWSAKEVIYKSYGLKNLDFKKNMKIHPFKYENEGVCKGELITAKLHNTYTIHYKKLGDLLLVYYGG